MKGRPDNAFLRTLGVRSSRIGGSRAYIAYPNLSRARWLLPPEPALRRIGLQLYTPQRLRGRLLKHAIASGAWRGQRVWIEGAALQELEGTLGECVGRVDTRLAFSLGTAGASRKATAQVIGQDGNVLGYAKIAIASLAQEALSREWRNLQRVSATALPGHVPKPIYAGTWRDARILLMTPGPAVPGPNQLDQSHFDFLYALHHATREECEFGSSAMFARLREAIVKLGGVWPAPWPRRLARALVRLEDQLGAVRVPFSFAHRDFAPWNTRFGAGGLFVFDWEVAHDGIVPLYDAFHFGAIRAATRNARIRTETAYHKRLLTALWPAGEECLRALYLAYLVDVSLLYGEARLRAPGLGDERAWLWFGRVIDHCLAADRVVA